MEKALIVDDEYFVRKGIISTIPWQQFGIVIEGEANNGQKALEFMQNHPIDLLFTDLSMPVMNGIDLMRMVQDEYPEVDIVVLTCHEDFKYIQDAMRLGAIEYIVKTEIENDHMQESLERIKQKRKKKNLVGFGRKEITGKSGPWSPEQEAKLQKEIEEWLPLYWTVNDKQFDILKRHLYELHPPEQELRKMLQYILIEWNRTLDFGPFHQWTQKAEMVGNWAEWVVFMDKLRNHLQQRIRVSLYPQDIVVRILQSVQWIRREMDAKMTQSFIAAEMRMSRGYFSKCFKDVIGTPFPDYLKDIRMSKAKSLLLQTDKSIADIAEECGFLDQRYFSRQFKLETGTLPSEYRKGVKEVLTIS